MIAKAFLIVVLTLTPFAGAYAAVSSDSIPVFPKPSVTQASVEIDGKRINYEVTAGHLNLVTENGKQRARVFFVAYKNMDNVEVGKRPITFSFNGGPGSSSVWLHLGVLGPRRVKLGPEGEALPPPHSLTDNAYSWLDLTDMVFIDPVSTGFSRASDSVNPKEFHGYTQDIESVGEFIFRYISDNGRWGSPKYLIGESYGTLRAAALSKHLQERYGMYLNGTILVSAVLNFQTLDFSFGNDLPYPLFLPTYTATAWFHACLPSDLQSLTLQQVTDRARHFAANLYTSALMKGADLTISERSALVDSLSRYTGLSPTYIERCELRPVIYNYCQELLRDKGQVCGRFDSRYTSPQVNRTAESMERDPSYHPAIGGAFSACVNDYLRRDLGVTTTLPYEVLTGRVRPWDMSVAQNKYLDVSQALQSAIMMNPDLIVWVLFGYYDLATPFYAAEYTVAHLHLPADYRTNIVSTWYQGGHMMYLIENELKAMKADAVKFYRLSFKIHDRQ